MRPPVAVSSIYRQEGPGPKDLAAPNPSRERNPQLGPGLAGTFLDWKRPASSPPLWLLAFRNLLAASAKPRSCGQLILLPGGRSLARWFSLGSSGTPTARFRAQSLSPPPHAHSAPPLPSWMGKVAQIGFLLKPHPLKFRSPSVSSPSSKGIAGRPRLSCRLSPCLLSVLVRFLLV